MREASAQQQQHSVSEGMFSRLSPQLCRAVWCGLKGEPWLVFDL